MLSLSAMHASMAVEYSVETAPRYAAPQKRAAKMEKSESQTFRYKSSFSILKCAIKKFRKKIVFFFFEFNQMVGRLKMFFFRLLFIPSPSSFGNLNVQDIRETM